MIFLRKINTTGSLYIPLKLNNRLLLNAPASAVIKRSINNGALTDFTNYTFDNGVLLIIDTFSSKVITYHIISDSLDFDDVFVIVETYGNTSAQIPFDFSSTSFPVDSTTRTNIQSIKAKTDLMVFNANQLKSYMVGEHSFNIVGTLSGSVGSVLGNVGGNINGNILGYCSSITGLNPNFLDTTVSSIRNVMNNTIEFKSTIVDFNTK